jgi:hypothetical protein
MLSLCRGLFWIVCLRNQSEDLLEAASRICRWRLLIKAVNYKLDLVALFGASVWILYLDVLLLGSI